MKLNLAATAALGIGVLMALPGGASAAGGCGPGFHPNPWGHCRPNLGPRFGGYGYGYRPVYGYGPRYGAYGGWHRHGWHHRW